VVGGGEEEGEGGDGGKMENLVGFESSHLSNAGANQKNGSLTLDYLSSTNEKEITFLLDFGKTKEELCLPCPSSNSRIVTL